MRMGYGGSQEIREAHTGRIDMPGSWPTGFLQNARGDRTSTAEKRKHMKKTMALITMMISFSLLAGCGAADSKSGETAPGQYKIIYDDSSFFLDPPVTAREGEEVLLKTDQVSSQLAFYLDREEIEFRKQSEIFSYSFTMPAHNVYVSCRKTGEYIGVPENARVLADSFNRITGTPMTQPYSEIVLYEAEPEDILEVYENGGMEDETVTRYYVSKDAYPEILNIILGCKMDTWNDLEDTYPIDGCMYAVRFWDGEKQIRVTSDAMPADGMQSFYAVDSAMYRLVGNADFYEKEDTGLQRIKEINKDGIVTKRQMLNWLEELDACENTALISVEQEKMKKKDIEYNCINVYLDKGYFPGEDFSVVIHRTILWKMFPVDDKEEADDEVSSAYRWDIKEGRRYCTSMYTKNDIELKEWSAAEAGGSILHYNIPDEYIREDDKGKYILFERAGQKYYLDGTVEILLEGGGSRIEDRIWTDDLQFILCDEY